MKRFLSLLLAAALLAMPMPASAAEASSDETAGSISATVRIDRPQTLDALRDREIQAVLTKNGQALVEVPLTTAVSADIGGYPVSVTLRNSDGGELNGSEWPGYLDLAVSGLPVGTYGLKFTGTGYVPYSHDVQLEDCSKHITIGTGDATFTLGDLDGNGKVDAQDRALVSNALGSTAAQDLKACDLNGDGKIDITDLAYVSHHIKASGDAVELDTYILHPGVDFSDFEAALDIKKVTVAEGSLTDLFSANGETVKLESSENAIELEIPFTQAQSMEEIQIVSPDADGKPVAGTVTVEDVNGVPEEFPFDLNPLEDVHAIGPVEGSSVITISLGRRVAVKKITISVTKTENADYAVVESIRFLQDIVPENPAPDNEQVRGLTAAPGDERVSLRWTELPNVSGYRVDYGLRDGGETRSLQVDRPQAEVSGLDNLKTYRFTVTPVDGSWSGKACEPVYAEPQPNKAPDAPDSVSISALDAALRVSWKASKTATYYEVFYQAAGASGYSQWGGQMTSTNTTLTGLVNGTEYSVYVVAGNSVGRSGQSRISVGTPVATDYSRPEGIPTEGIIDYNDIEQIRLADTGNVSSAAFPAGSSFQPSYMADGDFSTHWTSQSYNDGNWARSKQVLCTFTTPQDLASVIWVPRMDGGYKNNLRLYTVTIWKDGEDLNGSGTLLVPDPERGGTSSHLTWPSVGGNPGVNRFAILPMEPVTNVKKVAITIEQVGYTAVSLSELMFLRYDPEKCLPDNIASLFADDLRTSLKDGVTQEQIDGLRERLESDERNYYLNLDALADELDLAEELLKGENHDVVLHGIQSRSNAADNAKYKQSGSELQPLGIAAKAGEEITVYASGIPDGASVSLTASQFNAEVTAWQAQAGTLRNGRNLITIPKIGSQNTPRGGSLYLTYKGANPEGISLHVRRGTVMPVLELSGWYDLDDAARRDCISTYVDELSAYVTAQGITDGTRTANCLNVTEISTPTVLLSLPALAVWNSVKNGDSVEILYQDILAWEDVMHLCKTTQGIDNTYAANDMTSRQNIRCMQMFAGAFMYAAGNHIGIGYGSCGGMVCGRPLSSDNPALFGWGIAHEIGHNMDKLGKAEITNNIYSLVVQTADKGNFTGTSRLENSNKYPAIFNKTAQAYPGDSNDVFLQLGLYWQLHLAYDDGSSPLDFYNRFFKAWKDGTYTAGASSYGDRLALTAAGTANRDLTEFFTRWGVVLSDSAKNTLAGYPDESRAIWYLNDRSRRDRLNGVSAVSGTLDVSAVIPEGKDNEISLAITPSVSENVQGYEIRRSSDGGVSFQSIAFTKDTDYVDIIGSANNRTYTYQVAAYDTLGNLVSTGDSNQVRVSYDKTVDPSAYEVSRDENGAVTFTMKEVTPVSGLKILNAPVEGAFSVEITGKDENKAVTARSGDFSTGSQSADSYLTYFQKPGASSEDTRIWTYDALTVTVTGIPESVSDSDIRLVSYAGDDIAFLDGAAVGRLAKDYDCGGGDIIPAGTLVVVGTYRGNPLWQTIRVEGKFQGTAMDENGQEETAEAIRPMAGDAYLFAEVPDDGAVSDISDGLFLFVPNVQQEAELQGETSHCNAESLLPAQIRAVLSRTDSVDSAESQRVTAETLWLNSPGGDDLPEIVLE